MTAIYENKGLRVERYNYGADDTTIYEFRAPERVAELTMEDMVELLRALHIDYLNLTLPLWKKKP